MSQLGIGNLITGWVLLGLVVVTATTSLLNVYVILYEELKRRGKPWTLGTFFTRINSCQIAMNVSSVCYFCSIRREFLHLGESGSTQLQIFTATFLGLCQSFYIFFSWFRSSELVKVHTSSIFATILRCTVHAAPIFYLSPGVFLVFNSTQGHGIVLVVNGVLTLVLDTVFATRFLRQILQLRNVNIPVPDEFKIIASYGLLSSGLCSLAIIAFAATIVLNPAVGVHAIPQDAPVSYYVAFNLVFLFLALVAVAALVKWRLGRPTFFARESVQNLARDFLTDKESGHVKLSNANLQQSTVVNMRERHNAKARSSSLHKKKKQRFVKSATVNVTNNALDQNDTGADVSYVATSAPMPLLLDAKSDRAADPSVPTNILHLLPEMPEGKLTSKKRKRLEKFIQSQLKKEERVKLVKKLGDQHLEDSVGDLLKSSKALGSGKQTAKEKLRQSLKEHRIGIPISDPNSRLFVQHEQGGNDYETYDDYMDEDNSDSDNDDKEETETASKPAFGSSLKSNAAFGSSLKSDAPSNVGFGAAVKKSADGSAVPMMVIKKKKKKKQVKKKKVVIEPKFSGQSSDEGEGDSEDEKSGDSHSENETLEESGDEEGEEEQDGEEEESESEDETDEPKKSLGKAKGPVWNSDVVSGVSFPNQPEKKPVAVVATTKPAPKPQQSPAAPANQYYMQVHRSAETELSRMSLPILREEQAIMESILNKTTTILCGETGSGKTTQLPQFLYEHGFGNPLHPLYPGMIAITQPRRVAAVSMAKRVAEEMSMDLGKGPVGYQIRYDTSTVSAATRIKFMTEGILLRELSAAAESADSSNGENKNGKGGDLLLTKYSVIIIDEAHERTVGTDVLIGWLTRIATLRNSGKISGVKPLKLVIMSATLRVQDFTGNKVLFPPEAGIPPVVKVDGRQFKVTIHYNKVTPETDYISEAFKKVSKIHTKLPHGAILVFLTGQSEITTLVNRLRKAYPAKEGAIPQIEHEKNLLEKGKDGKENLESSDSMFGEAEDGQTDDHDDLDFLNEDGVDDFEDMAYLDEDDEEEETQTLAGAEGDEAEEVVDEEVDRENWPLHVLPLYSLLPTAAQMRVFEAPPPGTRLCVIATNVAETSLTIPGVKYVIDCGKVKERRYDTHTGVQTFQIGWTSRASADQRAGRAGRVAPGHCYRLFSSAVFANHFEQFSRPEMLRVPIEGVVLQMKSMGISNVLNFPFPTPPGRDNLRAGETLLVHLGAVERSSEVSESAGKITELGKMLAKFPVSPRFAKMLIIAADQPGFALPYTIALVSGMSCGDPFIRDDSVTGRKGEDDDDEDKEFKSKLVGEWHRVMQLFAGDPPVSDALRILRAIGAYSAAASKSPAAASQFIEKHFLRPKAIEEIERLRTQLATLVLTAVSFDKAGLKHLNNKSSMIPPPTVQDTTLLRQIILAGFPDQIARYDLAATKAALSTGAKNVKPIYTTMWGAKTDVFTIHGSSCLARLRPAPEWIVYEEVVGVEERLTADNSGILFTRPDSTVSAVNAGSIKNKKLMLKNVTAITEDWIAKVGPKSLLKPGKLLEQPTPRYDINKDKVVGFSAPNYGPKVWELPTMEVDVDLKNAVQWFALALLEGGVKPGHAVSKKAKAKKANSPKDMFGILQPYLTAKPAIITKSWSKVQSKVNSLLTTLLSKSIATRDSLVRIWYENPSFLLAEYLAWLPSELHMAVQLIWPPIEFIQEFEIIPSKPTANSKLPPFKEKPGILKKLEPFLIQVPKDDDLRRREVATAAARESDADSD
ncbi:ATP-dependent RNA helicase dhx37 [Chytriomyces hyalinus]|nr:ATP-dependent RNA helicase dhx37 [Chytriomyces hyalinus]